MPLFPALENLERLWSRASDESCGCGYPHVTRPKSSHLKDPFHGFGALFGTFRFESEVFLVVSIVFFLCFFFLGVCFDRFFFGLVVVGDGIANCNRNALFFLERISGYRQRERHFKIWIHEITTLLEAKITGYHMIPSHSNTFPTPWPTCCWLS